MGREDDGGDTATVVTPEVTSDDRGEHERRVPWWGPGFDVVRRGFDRAQVEEALDRAEADLKVVTADRDAMIRAEAEARAEARALRGELDRMVRTPLEVDGVSARLQHLLRLAEE